MNIFAISHFTLALSIGAFAMSAGAIEVGQVAPDFELPGKASPVRLSDSKGKAVYLDFWASWFGPCKQSFPWMNEMQAKYGSRGLKIVAINLDQKPEEAKMFLSENNATFDIAFDQGGKTPRTYSVKGMPTSFLITPDGKVAAVHSGFKPEQRSQLEQHIKVALNIKD